MGARPQGASSLWAAAGLCGPRPPHGGGLHPPTGPLWGSGPPQCNGVFACNSKAPPRAFGVSRVFLCGLFGDCSARQGIRAQTAGTSPWPELTNPPPPPLTTQGRRSPPHGVSCPEPQAPCPWGQILRGLPAPGTQVLDRGVGKGGSGPHLLEPALSRSRNL